MSQKESGPTSIFTIIDKICAGILAIAVLAAVAYSGTPAGVHRASAMEQDVTRLGMPGNDDFADVKRLAQTPAASAAVLVKQLHVLEHPERTITGEASSPVEHVLFSLLALRYVTGGMDFCARTKWTPGRSYEEGVRKYWLHFYRKSCVIFFADWPSRARTYIAPVDAQRAIINAWRQWCADHRNNADYHPLVNPPAYQWPEGIQKLIPVPQLNRSVRAKAHP